MDDAKDEFMKIASQSGKTGLEQTYALPNGVPGYVSEVRIPPGETIRVGTTKPQGSLPGGGTQIEVRRFDKTLVDEWFGLKPVKIDEYLQQAG